MAHFIRMLLFMAMGLGALYIMHLLAQDYNRIRKPVGAATRALISVSDGVRLLRGKRNADSAIAASLTSTDWKRILARDPFECLQSLICQLMTGAEGANTQQAVSLLDFLHSAVSVAPAQITRAFNRGLALRRTNSSCYDEYPFCFYSARTMLMVLSWFTDATPTE